VKTATNKRSLISESRGDSNICTSYRGKPDQHATCFSRSVHVWSTTICISHGPYIATFHTVINRFKQIHCTREERAPNTIHSTTAIWSVGPYLASLPQQPKSSGEKSSSCWQPTTRLTGPISPACDRYVQYLLTGVNRTVLNWHRRGLQPWRCWLATCPLPGLLNQLSPLSPSGPTWSLV
jgi:hypothetical protein